MCVPVKVVKCLLFLGDACPSLRLECFSSWSRKLLVRVPEQISRALGGALTVCRYCSRLYQPTFATQILARELRNDDHRGYSPCNPLNGSSSLGRKLLHTRSARNRRLIVPQSALGSSFCNKRGYFMLFNYFQTGSCPNMQYYRNLTTGTK